MTKKQKIEDDYDDIFEDIVSLSPTSSLPLLQNVQAVSMWPKSTISAQKPTLDQNMTEEKLLFDMLGDCVEFV